MDELTVVDLDTLRRRQAIYDKMKDRANRKLSETTGGTNSYKSIVREVEIEATNPFVGLVNRFFVSGRRLKPAIKQREVVPFDNLTQCKMHIHIIKAENVPIRQEFLFELERVN